MEGVAETRAVVEVTVMAAGVVAGLQAAVAAVAAVAAAGGGNLNILPRARGRCPGYTCQQSSEQGHVCGPTCSCSHCHVSRDNHAQSGAMREEGRRRQRERGGGENRSPPPPPARRPAGESSSGSGTRGAPGSGAAAGGNWVRCRPVPILPHPVPLLRGPTASPRPPRVNVPPEMKPNKTCWWCSSLMRPKEDPAKLCEGASECKRWVCRRDTCIKSRGGCSESRCCG